LAYHIPIKVIGNLYWESSNYSWIVFLKCPKFLGWNITSIEYLD